MPVRILPLFVYEPDELLWPDAYFDERRIFVIERSDEQLQMPAALLPGINIGCFAIPRADPYNWCPAAARNGFVRQPDEALGPKARVLEYCQVQPGCTGRARGRNRKARQPKERNMHRLHSALARKLPREPMELASGQRHWKRAGKRQNSQQLSHGSLVPAGIAAPAWLIREAHGLADFRDAHMAAEFAEFFRIDRAVDVDNR